MPDDQLTYYLAFDHRGLFHRDLFGLDSPLGAKDAQRVKDAKGLIYEGLLLASERDGRAETAALLVDEEFGSQIANDAVERGFTLAMPVERSDADEFDFEFGDDFGTHIATFNPTYAKVLVRYNPRGDSEANQRQLERLRRLSDWLDSEGRRFLFELIVPPTEEQLAAAGGDKVAYEKEQRPDLTLEAMREIINSGIRVDVWKLEGFDDQQDAERAAALARADGRDEVVLELLGAGAEED
ncbi:MAG: 2-deoxy-5-keto-D-gluconate 6-phosphate aldolase domain-containing protein, partial [Ilumatobacteraceae bacterium]